MAKEMSETLGASSRGGEQARGRRVHRRRGRDARAADGYKLLVTSLTLGVNPLLIPERYDYDPVRAFEPVANFASNPMLLETELQLAVQGFEVADRQMQAHPRQADIRLIRRGRISASGGRNAGAEACIKMVPHASGKDERPCAAGNGGRPHQLHVLSSVGISPVRGRQAAARAGGRLENR